MSPVKVVHLFFHLSVLLLLFAGNIGNGHRVHDDCPDSFECGSLGTITYFPFTKIEREECGALAIHGCDDPSPNATKSVQLHKGGKLFDVINVNNHWPLSISIVDHDFQKLFKNACEAFSYNNITLPPPSPLGYFYMKDNITTFKCNKSVEFSPPPNNFFKNHTCPHFDFYFGPPNSEDDSSLASSCSMLHLPVIQVYSLSANPLAFLADEITIGFDSSDECHHCYRDRKGHCRLDSKGNAYCAVRKDSVSKRTLAIVLATLVTAGVAVLMVFACCLRRRILSPKYLLFWRENPTQRIIEEFLKDHGSLPTARYSYSEIKKVTNSFRNKLGQGGYGSVYKGKLHDGRVIAVKLLSKSEGNGEEFINEVASISGTSHVNIVRLLGFCLDGSKRALIYEFMPNGSLEKFIYKDKNPLQVARQLDCETLYNIAVGVARGLEYLHRGCNTRIVHFDIKPHNILLDEEFCPKISDFGLAKICPIRKESKVSISGARGTVGYIAPEVFSRNFGVVSHKSDVYSYGMMVLEMVGWRESNDAEVECSSEIYFPHWIYNRLESNQELGLKNVRNEGDDKKVRTMTIVGLWCIQTNPSTRPAISRVVEMLEGRVELLQMPPKPSLSSPSTSPVHLSCETSIVSENSKMQSML